MSNELCCGLFVLEVIFEHAGKLFQAFRLVNIAVVHSNNIVAEVVKVLSILFNHVSSELFFRGESGFLRLGLLWFRRLTFRLGHFLGLGWIDWLGAALPIVMTLSIRSHNELLTADGLLHS